MEENEKYMTSIEGHINQLNNRIQEFLANATDREFINFWIDAAKAVVELGTGIEKLIGLAPMLMAAYAGGQGLTGRTNYIENFRGIPSAISNGIGSAGATSNAFGIIRNGEGLNFSDVNLDVIRQYNDLLRQTESIEETMVQMQGPLNATNNATRAVITSAARYGSQMDTAAQGARAATLNMTAFSAASRAAAVAQGILNAAIGMFIGAAIAMAIGAIVKAIDNWIHKEEKLAEKAEEANNKIKEQVDYVNELKSAMKDLPEKYAELAQGVDLLTNTNKKLNDEQYQEFLDTSNKLAETFPELVLGYDENGNAILSLSGSVEQITEDLKEYIKTAKEAAAQEINENLPDVMRDLQAKEEKNKKQDVVYELERVNTMREALTKSANGTVLIDPEQTRYVSDMLYGFQRFLDASKKDVRIGIDFQTNGLFFEGEDAADIEQNFDDYFGQYQHSLTLKVQQLENATKKQVAETSANLNQIVDTMDLEDADKAFVKAIVGSGDWYDKFKEEGIDPENIGIWFTSEYVNGLLGMNGAVKEALLTVLSPDGQTIAQLQEYWQRIIDQFGDKDGNLPGTLQSSYNNFLANANAKKSNILEKFKGNQSAFDSKLDTLSQEDLDIAASLDVPAGTLATWDELIKKINLVKMSLAEADTEKEGVTDAAARNLGLDFTPDEDGNVAALDDKIQNYINENQGKLDKIRAELKEAQTAFENAAGSEMESAKANYDKILEKYNNELDKLKSKALSAAKDLALFDGAVSDLGSSLDGYLDVLKKSDGEQGKLIRNSAQYSDTLAKLSADLTGLSGVEINGKMAKEFLKSEKNAKALKKALEGDDSALQQIQEDLRIIAGQDVNLNEKLNVDDATLEANVNLNSEEFDAQFDSFYSWLEAHRNLGTLDAQSDLNTQPFFNAINELLQKGAIAASELESMFDGLGWDIEWETKTVQVWDGIQGVHEQTIKLPKIKSISSKTNTTPHHITTSGSGSGGSKGKGGGGGGGGGGDSKSEPTTTEFNWIDRSIKKITDTIAKLQDQIENTWTTWSSRIKNTNKELKETQTLIDKETKAQKSYRRVLNNIGKGKNIDGSNNKEWSNLSKSKKWKKYTDLMKNGKIGKKDLEIITDKEGKDFAGQLQAYMDWYDKIVESKANVRQYQQQVRDLIKDKYDKKITKIENQLELLQAGAELSTTEYETKSKTQVQNVKSINSYYKVQKKAIKKQRTQLKNEEKNLQKELNEMRKNGLKTSSEEYQEWLKKKADLDQRVAENEQQLIEENIAHGQALVDKLSTAYQKLVDLQTHQLNMLNNYSSLASAQGQFMSNELYSSIEKLHNTRLEDAEKYAKDLRDQIEKNLSSGKWTKDTQEYKDALNTLRSKEEEILSIRTAQAQNLEDQKKTLMEMYQLRQNYISDLRKETEFYRNLLTTEHELYDTGSLLDPGTGRMNEYGQAYASTYAVDYDTAMAQADKAKKAYEEFEKTADKTNKNDVERLRQLQDEWRSYINAAESAKKSNVEFYQSMYQEILKSLQKMIDKRKENINLQKTEYDYAKKIKDQTQDLNTIRKQIAVYQGDDSEENRARLQKLQVQLKNAEESLEESEYEKWISDTQSMLDDMYKEFEDLYDRLGRDIDGRMKETITAVNDGAEGIKSTIDTELGDVGGTMTSEMQSIFGSGSTIAAFYEHGFTDGVTTIENAVKGMSDKVDSMVTNLGTEWGNYVETNNPGIGSSTTTGNSSSVAPTANNDATKTGYTYKVDSSGNVTLGYGGKTYTMKYNELPAFADKNGIKLSTIDKNANKSAWFKGIFSKYPSKPPASQAASYIKAKMYTEDALKNLLKQYGITANKSLLSSAYAKVGGKDKYTGSKQQIMQILDNLQANGFSSGGSVAGTFRSLTGEDGIALVRKGEYILTPDMLENAVSVVKPLSEMAKYGVANNQSVSVDNLQVTFDLPNVKNYEEFKNQLVADSHFEKQMQQMVLGGTLGQNRYKKFNV